MEDPRRTKVLISAGSRHGSTAEMSERIGAVLRDHGHDVDVTPPEQVTRIDGYDAVVVGSAVYAGQWVPSAKQLAHRVALSSPPIPTWLFSSGPIGDPPKPEEDPVDVAEILEVTSAREHRVFSGKVDKSKLSFGEKAILLAVRAPEGDFRDWEAITGWANDIADKLVKEVSQT